MIFSNISPKPFFINQDTQIHFPEKFEYLNEESQSSDPYEIEKTQLSEIDIKIIADKISSKLIKLVEEHLQKK